MYGWWSWMWRHWSAADWVNHYSRYGTGAQPPMLPANPYGSVAHPVPPTHRGLAFTEVPAFVDEGLRRAREALAFVDEGLRRAREAFNLFEQQVLDLDASCAGLGLLSIPDELGRLIDRYKSAGNSAVLLGGVGPTIDAASTAMAPILARVPGPGLDRLSWTTKQATQMALSANLSLQNVLSYDPFDFNVITTKARCAQVSAWAHQMASAYSGALSLLEGARSRLRGPCNPGAERCT